MSLNAERTPAVYPVFRSWSEPSHTAIGPGPEPEAVALKRMRAWSPAAVVSITERDTPYEAGRFFDEPGPFQ